jgi:hypothetical protein
MRGMIAAMVALALCVVGAAMASARPATASPALICDVTSIPAKSASVWTTCTVTDFPPNMTVRIFTGGATATTDASGRASAALIIPCCFPHPAEITITATAEDGTTASTTFTVVAAAAASVSAQPTLTG